MRKFFTLKSVFLIIVLSVLGISLNAQVGMTTTGSYVQNFNTLASTGTAIPFSDNVTIPNWYFQRTGTGLTYSADAGSSNAGGLYSYGSVSNGDRAIGTVGSSNATAGSFANGVLLKNTSGTTITDIKVTYTLEQWRNSAATGQIITFYYKKSSTTFSALNPNSNATWTQVSALNITSPIIGGAAGALDGNAVTNKVTATNIAIPGLSLADNEFIMLKWEDPDHTGSDHGLAIDDVTINWTVTPVISSNADLSTLVVNNSSFTNTAVLTPSFSSSVINYTTSVNNATSPVLLSFTRAQANSFVEASLNGGVYNSPLLSMPLLVGANTIDVRVTAQDGITVKVYRINITRAAPATPVIVVSSNLSPFGNLCINTSAIQSFTIDGTDLDGSNIEIDALPGFTYAEAIGGPYVNTVSISSSTNFTGKIIYVKFTPTSVQSYNGNIVLNGGGVSGFLIPVSAAGINSLPTVSSLSNNVSGTTAILTGNLSDIGCSAIIGNGFEYSSTNGFVNGSGIQVTSGNLGLGNFSSTVSGLSANVTYYYKAFSTNAAGTAYGAQQSFTTSSIIPVVMASEPLFRYTENFSDITSWSSNFTAGIGANRFGSVAVNATGTIPDGVRTSVSSANFSSGTSGGVQKGSGNMQLLSTGATDNTSAVAVDFYMDFTGVNAGTLSFDWASVNNSTGNRNASLRVYASVDGINFTNLPLASVLNFTNNVTTVGTVNSIALPASFNNSANARLRFYFNNGTGGTTGSRPKISIDNLTVTAVANTPCITPDAATTLSFGAIAETTIQGSFSASIPASNEYLVVMSTGNALTSNPINGQAYTIGDNVGDGTVIAKGSSLNFTASGLTGATTYYFFVFAVNSVCTGGPLYSVNSVNDNATTVAGLPVCIAPIDQPTNLIFGSTTINSIQASFTASSGNEYLVLQSTDPALTNNPINAQVYNAGDMIGNAIVIQRSNALSFTATGLLPNTTYYYYVMSLNTLLCVNGPAYNIISPLSASQTSLPLSPCATPVSQSANLALNASNSIITGTFNGVSGSGYTYLVVRSTVSTLSSNPLDNTDYIIGDNLGGGVVIGNTAFTSFSTNNLLASTTYYFYIFSADKNCTGGTKYLTSNPLIGNITTTSTPANNYYFGTLHSHSDYSDGNKDRPGFTPTDNYTYASASNGMDFLGISEHNHFSSLDNPGNELIKYHSGITEANNFNITHPNFLALYGMEWGVISGGGHVVVYGNQMNDLYGWESNVNGTVGPNYDVFVPKNTYTGANGLFKTINDNVAKNTFASLAHPGNSDYNNLSNLPYDQSADDAISATAVESGPATSSNTTYSNPGSSMFYLWYYQKLLSKGYHLGPTIDHDNHNTTFGRTTTARTAVISPSLLQADIIKAVKDMHFYATQDIDAKVDFTINTRIMGSIFQDRNAPSIAVTINDATTNTSNALIRVMFGVPGSNTLPVVIDSVFGSSLNFVDNSLPNQSTGYYYIDITNGATRMVTSPIWYTRICSASSEFTMAACDTYTWDGTTYTNSGNYVKNYTTPAGCDSTVTLHLTINASPVSSNITLNGSDTGCPAVGVGFTATAIAGVSEPVSSYQWLLNGIPLIGQNAASFTALQTGVYSVKAIDDNQCFVLSNSLQATVIDNIAPVADVPVLPPLTGECAITISNIPTATDNCAGVLTATTSDPLIYTQQGEYTIHWTFNDGNGNEFIQTQTVIISDVIAPVITAPSNIVTTNDAGICGAIVNYTATVTDNCDPFTVSYSQVSGTLFPIGETMVTITAVDHAGNTSSANFTVTVLDNESPSFTVPANISVNNDPGQCNANVNIGNATATDNCGVNSVVNDHASNTYSVGTTTVTWTVTDIHGNVSTATQTITVADNETPTVMAPASITVTNDPGQCSAEINIGIASATDNCEVSSVVNDHVATSYPVGTTTVTWTVTDIHGNPATSTQTITVNDNESPIITAPAGITITNDPGQCAAIMNIGNASATDNCGVASVVNDHPLTSYPVGTTMITWTATDIHGNVATATQTITVIDNESPIITAPESITVTNDPGQCSAEINIGIASATDNCGVASVLNDHAATSYPVGTTIVNWVVTDVHGNTASTSQTIVVTDSEKPVVICPAPQVFCSNIVGNNMYTISALTMPTDNCGVASISYAITGATIRNGMGNNASGTFAVGVSILTWTVIDIHGNVNTCSTSVTINPLPVSSITVSNADAFCNQFVLTGNSSLIGPFTYQWMLNNVNFGVATPSAQLFLSNTSADGNYTLITTDVNGCRSNASAVYTYQKQNLVNSYTILAYKSVEIGKYHKVKSGSVGVMTSRGKAEFKKYSSVNGPGSFVKAPIIERDGTNILITTPIIGIATVGLPTMQYNTTVTRFLPNYIASINNAIIAGNYNNLTIKKNVNVILGGNTYGTIKLEEGASIRFTGAVLNIDNLVVEKGARNGQYSYMRFAPNTSVRVSTKVSLGSRVRVNEENQKVTFYMGDLRSDDEKFSVRGGETKVIANIFMPDGKLKVSSTESGSNDNEGCNHRAHSSRDCKHRGHDHNDCDHRDHAEGQCGDGVYMTGLFIAEEVKSEGNIVFWNNYNCNAPSNTNITSVTNASKATAENKMIVVNENAELKVTVLPNPTTTFFTLKLESKYETPVNMRVMDGTGRVVDARTKIGSNSTIQIGHNYSSGTYYAEMIQGTKRKVVQLIKAKG